MAISKTNRVRICGRTPASLAEQLLRRLNGYSIAAGAAGVAMLASAAPVEAAPICGKLSVTFSYTGTYAFNPANLKVPPFNVAQTFNNVSELSQSRMFRGFFTPNTPDANLLVSAGGFVEDLASGALIGESAKFGKGLSYGKLFEYRFFKHITGNFASGEAGYAGFEFSESGHIHYGWLRLKVNERDMYSPSLDLSQFGYESTSNTSIAAGSCGSLASSVGKGSEAQPRAPIPASLGVLAQGSDGLRAWRR